MAVDGRVWLALKAHKKLNATGLRPGAKAKDPLTGEVFRVP